MDSPIFTEGSSEYATCEGLIFESSSSWPESSLFEIAHNGVPLHKIVIGKPGKTDDASNGYMTTNMLAGCLEQAKRQGWKGGAMTWEVSAVLGFFLLRSEQAVDLGMLPLRFSTLMPIRLGSIM